MTCNPPLAPCQSRSRVFLRPGAQPRLETGVWGYCQLLSVLCSKCSNTNIPSIKKFCASTDPHHKHWVLLTIKPGVDFHSRTELGWTVEVSLRTFCSFHLECRKLLYVLIAILCLCDERFLLSSVDVECEVCDETQRSQTRLITATRNYICNNKSHNIIYE